MIFAFYKIVNTQKLTKRYFIKQIQKI